MNPHLKHIPRLTPLATRRLSRRDLQALRRQAHGTLDAQVLGLGALDQLLADFLEGLHFARGQGDADFVDFLSAAVSIREVDADRGVMMGDERGLRRNLSRAFGRTLFRFRKNDG